MIRRAEDRVSFEKCVFGGPGMTHFCQALNEGEFSGKGRMFNTVMLHPGECLGKHAHNGEFEVYLILRGEGEYDDNGTKATVRAGDVTICPDGESHGIANVGKEDLEFVALILFTGPDK